MLARDSHAGRVDDVGFDAAGPEPARQPEPVAACLEGDGDARDLAAFLGGLARQRINKRSNSTSLGSSFFTWHSAGTMLATSQLAWSGYSAVTQTVDLALERIKPAPQFASDVTAGLTERVAALDLWAVRLPIGSVARRDSALGRDTVLHPLSGSFPSHGFLQGPGRARRRRQTSGDKADAQHGESDPAGGGCA